MSRLTDIIANEYIKQLQPILQLLDKDWYAIQVISAAEDIKKSRFEVELHLHPKSPNIPKIISWFKINNITHSYSVKYEQWVVFATVHFDHETILNVNRVVSMHILTNTDHAPLNISYFIHHPGPSFDYYEELLTDIK